jgi:hypothetical protein
MAVTCGPFCSIGTDFFSYPIRPSMTGLCGHWLFVNEGVGGAIKVYALALETDRLCACAKRRNIKWVLTNFGDENDYWKKTKTDSP